MLAPSPFVSLCGTVAPWTSIILTLSPLPTLLTIPRGIDIKSDEDVEGLIPSTSKVTINSLPLLPYSSMAVNGSLWMMYGLLLKAPPLILCNFVGACLAFGYCLIFAAKSSPLKNDRYVDLSPSSNPGPSLWTRIDLPSTVRTHLTVGATILGLGLTCFLGGMKNQLASLATLVCGVMFISPLVKLGAIMKSKSCPPGTIPLPFTLATAVNCFLWSIYGIKGIKDIAVTAPNVFGLLCAISQFGVMLLYGGTSSSRKVSFELM